jgi:beta-N-acetylhexosaminidase
MPTPTDQTPADTSSTVAPGLARALRRHHGAIDEFVVGHAPTDDEIASVRMAVAGHEIVVVGTTAALLGPRQAALVEGLLANGGGARVVTVALRTPFDLAAYPASRTHLSTYGVLEPTLDALADVLFGRTTAVGRLPAAVPGLHPTGHGIDRR